MSVLLKPIFVKGMFNRTGKKMRAVLNWTVTAAAGSYDLYHKDGKPDNSYFTCEDDKYILYVKFGDWLIPLNCDKNWMIEHIGYHNMIIKYYGGDEEARTAAFYEARDEGNAIKFLKQEKDVILEMGKDPETQYTFIKDYLEYHKKNYCKFRDGLSKYPDYIGQVLVEGK